MLLALSLANAPAIAEPWRPASDAEIVEQLPQGAPSGLAVALPVSTLDYAIAAARASLLRGQRYSDPREYGYAEAMLKPWQQRAPDDLRLALLDARILQFRHEFDAARNKLQALLGRDPRNAEAWLLLSTIDQVQGNYTQARSACGRLVGQADLLVAITCGVSVGSLTGHAVSSTELLQRQLDGSPTSEAVTRVWAWTVLAEIRVRIGAVDAAADAFRSALAIDGDDVYALAAFADLELQRDRPQAALDLIGDRLNADALLLRAAIAARRSGAANAAELHAAFNERVAEMTRRGDLSHRRELARAALELDDQPDVALALALDNWKVQREPADAALVLATAKASGHHDAGDSVLAFIREHGLEDRRLAALAESLK